MKTPLLLLHGALGAASQFDALKRLLQDRFEVHTPDFSGHGAGAAIHDFRIAVFAQDVLNYMDEHQLSSVSVFGYSMGGYVALYLARHSPERINSIVTLATKFHWDEATALKESGMLDVAKIEAKVPQLANALTERHPNTSWKDMVIRTAAMLLDMGSNPPLKAEDLALLQQPITLLLGDRDKMVSLEETVTAYKSLPAGKMGMLPGTPHPYESADINLLSILIQHFI